MKKIIVTLLSLAMLGAYQVSYGQGIPEPIKKEILSLAKEGDKRAKNDPDGVKEYLIDFLSQAPPSAVPMALDLMRENSSSAEFHQVLDDLAKSGMEGVEVEKEEEPKTTIFTNVKLIDGSGSKARSNTTIVFTGDTITDILKRMPKTYPEDAEVVDMKGKYVMPGLIDAHVHMATDPTEETYDYVQQSFRSMLGSGIVGVRDMGGDGRALAYYSRQVATNDMLGPDLYYSSILAGPDFFSDGRPISASRSVELGTGAWAHEVTKDTDLTALMQRVKGIGSTGVKMYYDVDAALVKKIAVAARKAGIKVWSHWVVTPANGTETIRAGVEVVSHAEFIEGDIEGNNLQAILDKHGEDKLYNMMKDKGTILDSTLAVVYETASGNQARMAALITKNALDEGVEIAAGSDLPVSEDGLPGGHVEFRLLASKAGMTPAQVMNSAAIVNAKVLGKQDELGVIAKGKNATFLVYENDPMKSVASWSEPLYVVKKGIIYSGKALRDPDSDVTPITSF